MSIAISPLTRWFYQGQPAANAQINVYESGTTTPVTVYNDAALTQPATNPVVTDSNGEAEFYVSPDQALRYYVTTSGGQLIHDLDPVYPVSAASAQTTSLSHGQCRLVKSGSNLALQPYNGNKLVINGVSETIPSAGVTLAPTGLSATTLYYIYAFMSLGVMYLEASTTGYSTDTTTGVKIKTGDPSRTLVGMARTIAGPAWQDATNQRLVASYFNRLPRYVTAAFSTARTTTSTSAVEINAEIRNEFLTWGDSLGTEFSGYGSNNGAAGVAIVSAIGLDGAVTILSSVSLNSPASTYAMNLANGTFYETTEGYHYTTVVGNVSGNTGTWTSGTLRTSLSI